VDVQNAGAVGGFAKQAAANAGAVAADGYAKARAALAGSSAGVEKAKQVAAIVVADFPWATVCP